MLLIHFPEAWRLVGRMGWHLNSTEGIVIVRGIHTYLIIITDLTEIICFNEIYLHQTLFHLNYIFGIRIIVALVVIIIIMMPTDEEGMRR